MSKSKQLNSNFNLTKTVTHDDHVVPDLETAKINSTFIESTNMPISAYKQPQENQHDADKLSETSSDSGQGQSEMLTAHDFDASDSCLNSGDTISNYSETKDTENKTTDELELNCSSSSNDATISIDNDKKEHLETSSNQIVPLKEDILKRENLSHTSFNSLETTCSAVSSNSVSMSSSGRNNSSKKSIKNSKSANIDKKNSDPLKKKDSSLNNKAKTDAQKEDNQEQKESSLKPKDETLPDMPSYEDLVAYEFNFPRKLCGILIGKNGVHVDTIRSKTQTQIGVRNDPNSNEMQIVCVSGRLKDVDRALDIISLRFPAKVYPQISFKPISKPIVYRRYNPEKTDIFTDSKILVAPNMFVEITSLLSPNVENTTTPNKIDTITNITNKVNVHVTAVVSASHIFIQLPTHPTFENLQKLDESMSSLYNNIVGENVPLMIEPIEFGTICVAPTSYGWHRAMVTNYQSREDTCKQVADYNENCGLATIKFLDYGGYLTLPSNQLRQLRSVIFI